MNRGSARAVTGWTLLALGLIAFAADVARLNMTGLALAGVVVMTLAVWILGGFRREAWIADITDTHPDALGSLDLAERAHHQENQR